MDNREKFEMMQKIVRELDDLKNSQTAVLKKISQIEADNINLSNKTLEDALPEIFENVDNNLAFVTGLLTDFSAETDKFETDHNLAETPSE